MADRSPNPRLSSEHKRSTMDVEEIGPACFVEDGPDFFLRFEEAEPFAPVVPWTPPAPVQWHAGMSVKWNAGISSGAKTIKKQRSCSKRGGKRETIRGLVPLQAQLSRMSGSCAASTAAIAPSPAALIHPDVAWLVLNQLQPTSAKKPDRMWMHTMGQLACVCSAFNDATKALWSYYDGIADEEEWVRHGLRRDVWWCWAVESNRRRHAAEKEAAWEADAKQNAARLKLAETQLVNKSLVPAAAATPKRKGKARLVTMRPGAGEERGGETAAVFVFDRLDV